MRKIVLLLGITCLFGSILPHIASAEIDPEKAAGIWLFDEGAGNDVEDLSGKENHGAITGAKWVEGKFGDGLEFNGGQSVEIASTPDLQLGDEHTMMAWLYVTNIAEHRQLIAKNNEYLLRIDRPGENNKMSAFVSIGGWEPRASSVVPETKTWIHFAATYDSGANADQLVVYVNGERKGSSTRPGKGAGNNDAVTIGTWNGGSFFIGIIDEVAIFKSVLTEDDLQTIMEHGLEKTIKGIAAVEATNKLATTWSTLKQKHSIRRVSN